MQLLSTIAVAVLLTLSVRSIKAEYPQTDEFTLRNQLLADVFLLKEGVDKLLISSEVLNRRFNNQMDILKTFQNKLISDNFHTDEIDTNCDKIAGMFNATLRKQNILENRLMGKLEEIQDEELNRFEEMLIKLRLNKNYGTQTGSSSSLTTLSTTLADISEQIEQFGEKLAKFELLEENTQIKLDKFAENQEKILQQINDIFAKNQKQFDKINADIMDLKELNTDLKKIIVRPRPKLPMEVILGLTSANLTSSSFK